ncbi:hypothetical protein D3C86_242910 [compost metagenome]
MVETQHYGARCLLERGVVTPEQIRSAFAVRKECPTLLLTDALLTLGCVTFRQLRAVLYEIHPDLKLGDALVGRRKITQSTLDEALLVQEREGGRIGEILVRMRAVDPVVLAEALDLQAVRRRRMQALRNLVYRVMPRAMKARLEAMGDDAHPERWLMA